MSKRAGFTMPKDRAEAVQAFVDQGRQDEAPAAATAAPRMPTGGETARLNVDMPKELHRRFKTACAADGVKMAEIVIQLIEGWTAEKR